MIYYGLIAVSLWICVLIILARESVFSLFYFPGFCLFVVVVILTIMFYFTFRRITLIYFYIYFLRVN